MVFVPAMLAAAYVKKKPNIPEEINASVEEAMLHSVDALFQSDKFRWLLIRAEKHEKSPLELYQKVRQYGLDLVSRAKFGVSVDIDCLGMKTHRFLLESSMSEYAGEHTRRYFELIHEELTKNLAPIKEIWEKHNLSSATRAPRSL